MFTLTTRNNHEKVVTSKQFSVANSFAIAQRVMVSWWLESRALAAFLYNTKKLRCFKQGYCCSVTFENGVRVIKAYEFVLTEPLLLKLPISSPFVRVGIDYVENLPMVFQIEFWPRYEQTQWYPGGSFSGRLNLR